MSVLPPTQLDLDEEERRRIRAAGAAGPIEVTSVPDLPGEARSRELNTKLFTGQAMTPEETAELNALRSGFGQPQVTEDESRRRRRRQQQPPIPGQQPFARYPTQVARRLPQEEAAQYQSLEEEQAEAPAFASLPAAPSPKPGGKGTEVARLGPERKPSPYVPTLDESIQVVARARAAQADLLKKIAGAKSEAEARSYSDTHKALSATITESQARVDKGLADLAPEVREAYLSGVQTRTAGEPGAATPSADDNFGMSPEQVTRYLAAVNVDRKAQGQALIPTPGPGETLRTVLTRAGYALPASEAALQKAGQEVEDSPDVIQGLNARLNEYQFAPQAILAKFYTGEPLTPEEAGALQGWLEQPDIALPRGVMMDSNGNITNIDSRSPVRPDVYAYSVRVAAAQKKRAEQTTVVRALLKSQADSARAQARAREIDSFLSAGRAGTVSDAAALLLEKDELDKLLEVRRFRNSALSMILDLFKSPTAYNLAKRSGLLGMLAQNAGVDAPKMPRMEEGALMQYIQSLGRVAPADMFEVLNELSVTSGWDLEELIPFMAKLVRAGPGRLGGGVAPREGQTFGSRG